MNMDANMEKDLGCLNDTILAGKARLGRPMWDCRRIRGSTSSGCKPLLSLAGTITSHLRARRNISRAKESQIMHAGLKIVSLQTNRR